MTFGFSIEFILLLISNQSIPTGDASSVSSLMIKVRLILNEEPQKA
jgi:hypothetical protein